MKFIKYVPNILTGLRFVFIPFIIFAILHKYYIAALVIFTISSGTDIIDGYVARHFNAISDVGKLLDPLADKLTQISVLLTLSIQHMIPFWIFVVLLSKEIILIVGASFLYGKDLVVSSKWYGKLTTVLIYLAVVSSLFINIYGLYHFDVYIYAIAIVFAIISLFSYIHYFYGEGYLPNKEELKEAARISEPVKKTKKKKKK